MNYLKESIKVEIETFKVIVYIVILLAGGVSALLIQLYEDLDNIALKGLFIIGLIFLLIFTFLAFNRYIAIKNILKKIKKKEE